MIYTPRNVKKLWSKVVLLSLLFAPYCFAQETKDETARSDAAGKTPVPLNLSLFTKAVTPREGLEREYKQTIFISAADPLYHFKLSMNKNWRVIDRPPTFPSTDTENSQGSIGLLRRIAVPQAEIEIFAVLIPREVDPADWLEAFIISLGQKIIDSRMVFSDFGIVGEYLSTATLDEKMFVYRTLGIKDANRILILQACVAADGYEKVKEEFLMAVKTFELINPTREKYAEPIQTHKMTQPINCEFLFPASWMKKEDKFAVPNGTSFSLVNQEKGVTIGQFALSALPHELEETYKGVFQNYVEQLKNSGFEIDALDLKKQEPSEPLVGMWESIFPIKKDGNIFEVRCCVIEHEQAWFLFTLFGPSKDFSREAQMINSRAFRLALETFKVSE
jgi:hypothetical protein